MGGAVEGRGCGLCWWGGGGGCVRRCGRSLWAVKSKGEGGEDGRFENLHF